MHHFYKEEGLLVSTCLDFDLILSNMLHQNSLKYKYVCKCVNVSPWMSSCYYCRLCILKIARARDVNWEIFGKVIWGIMCWTSWKFKWQSTFVTRVDNDCVMTALICRWIYVRDEAEDYKCTSRNKFTLTMHWQWLGRCTWQKRLMIVAVTDLWWLKQVNAYCESKRSNVKATGKRGPRGLPFYVMFNCFCFSFLCVKHFCKNAQAHFLLSI